MVESIINSLFEMFIILWGAFNIHKYITNEYKNKFGFIYLGFGIQFIMTGIIFMLYFFRVFDNSIEVNF